ncbi:hypothetical protein GTP38_25270 [Duganella sp. FT94W]|uniref:Uncharacterized protein n=1 Tax=Duganella lactea TaxID=2692173 RepID=A0ABW9VDT3_9BURK|nr:hypothetical protein [Duganella lactea]MYM37640.1 hypothetical protein [Duganella lactea]
MQFGVIFSLVGAALAAGLFAFRRQWLMSLAWLFSLAYTTFSRVFPEVFPEPLVTCFSVTFLVLVVVACWQNFYAKKAH